MKASLIALLAPSAAMAFTAVDLRGVWHCVPHDGYMQDPAFTPGSCSNNQPVQKAACVAALAGWTPSIQEKYVAVDSAETSQRVVVFDAPENSKATRRLTGRTYYKPKANGYYQAEEHDFHGMLQNAVEGTFYLDPNSHNVECNGVLKDATDVAAKGGDVLIPAGAAYTKPLSKTDPEYILPLAATAATLGSCRAVAEGPWQFEFSDVDHFTLHVDPRDMQQDHYAAVAFVHHEHARIHITEKCMRGLPNGNEFCARLQRSKITSSEDMNRACQGPLECAQSSSSQNWGCNGKKCCAERGYVAPRYNYQQPSYYQPSYYQQPNNFPQYNQNSFWG